MKKKIYKTPVLKNFGSVALSTQQTQLTVSSDAGMNQMGS